MIDKALEGNARYLNAAVLRITRGASKETDRDVELLGYFALATDRALDDAVRHYLSETGAEANLRTPVVQAANRITHLRIAAEVIADIHAPHPPLPFRRARAMLESHAQLITARSRRGTRCPKPAIIDEIVPVLRSEAKGSQAIDTAVQLLTVAANLGELAMH